MAMFQEEKIVLLNSNLFLKFLLQEENFIVKIPMEKKSIIKSPMEILTFLLIFQMIEKER